MSWFTSKSSPVRASSFNDLRTETHYPRLFDIGVAAGGVIFCVTVLVTALFAEHGFTHFASLAYQVIK